LLQSSPTTAEERTVRFLEPEDRAVVLGSTQPESHIDRGAANAAAIAVLRRRSGGGAVLVGPGQVLWTDVVIPVGDPLWTADVGRAFWWIGDLWAAAFSAAGLAGVVWRGGLVRSQWSDRVCFAGLGAGEVTAGGAKVLGLAQRRTRATAQFQCAVPIVWEPSELLAIMALDDGVRPEAAVALAGVAMGVGAGLASEVVTAFLDRLP
jgi:lipoate-protein ligase A